MRSSSLCGLLGPYVRLAQALGAKFCSTKKFNQKEILFTQSLVGFVAIVAGALQFSISWARFHNTAVMSYALKRPQHVLS